MKYSNIYIILLKVCHFITKIHIIVALEVRPVLI